MKRFRKKFTLTLLLYVSGTALAFKAGSSLSEYTAYATILLAGFGVTDVADKKLNGGTYDGGSA